MTDEKIQDDSNNEVENSQEKTQEVKKVVRRRRRKPKTETQVVVNEPIKTYDLKIKNDENQEKNICGNCGNEIIGHPEYCPYCGAHLDWSILNSLE